jgi:hypothetical protein
MFYLSLSLLVGAFLSAGCPDDGNPDNDGGVGGNGTGGTLDAGAGGTGGTAGTGDAGVGGTGGSAGAVGSGPPDCGATDACAGVTDFFAYCEDNFCGTFENIEFAFCGIDGNLACVCLSGACDRSDCADTPTCTFDQSGDELCQAEAERICGGAASVREGFCSSFSDGLRCEVLCDSGAAACPGPP